MIYVHIFNYNNYEISKIITHVQANDWDMLRTCSIQVLVYRFGQDRNISDNTSAGT